MDKPKIDFTIDFGVLKYQTGRRQVYYVDVGTLPPEKAFHNLVNSNAMKPRKSNNQPPDNYVEIPE